MNLIKSNNFFKKNIFLFNYTYNENKHSHEKTMNEITEVKNIFMLKIPFLIHVVFLF